MNQKEIRVDITKELNELLNDNTVKTPEKARVVAGRLLRRGVQPTWRLVRDILGTGSATTLQSAVNQYWNELGGYLDALENRPELPKHLISEFNSVWDKALQLSEKKLEKRLEKAFDKAKYIEEEANNKNRTLEAELKKENRLKIVVQKQQKQLEQRYNVQYIQLEQAKKSQTKLEATIQEKEESYSASLDVQQQDYYSLEQSLQQLKQQLRSEKSQYVIVEKQHQKTLLAMKQDHQNELDRQAKQYDSMLDHYSNEIGALKVKQDTVEKQQTKYKKQQQMQRERNLVTITEQQSMITSLSQNNKHLDKKNTNKTTLITTQQIEIQQLHKMCTKLEIRLEILTLNTADKNNTED